MVNYPQSLICFVCIFTQIQTVDTCYTIMKLCHWPMLDGRYIYMHIHQLCDEFMSTYNCFLIFGVLID